MEPPHGAANLAPRSIGHSIMMMHAGIVCGVWVALTAPATWTPSPLRMSPTHRVVKMQYGAQPGYGAQQGYGAEQGYGAQQGYGTQQGYGAVQGHDAQQGYGSYGGRKTWRVSALNGIQGSFKQEELGVLYGTLPYTMRNGDEFALGRFNMVRQKTTVSRVQAIVQVLVDGTAVLVSRGSGASGVRSRGGSWNALHAGETHVLSDGDHISMDVNDPEGAVFMIHDCTPPPSKQQQQDGAQVLPPGWQGVTQPLPPGWSAGVDQASGQTYYYNELTGQSQWDPPQPQGGY